MKKLKPLAVAICLAAVFSLSSCISFEIPDFGNIQNPDEATTTLIINNNGDYSYNYQETTNQNTSPDVPSVEGTVPEAPDTPTTQQSTVSPEPSSSSQSEDYSSYSKKKIISVYEDALNKTRNYSGSLSATVTEAFSADIKDAHPGGALTELLASNIVKLVGSEGSQTLSFSNGRATNKDGESVPVLLPQRTSFSLPESGVKSASITEENGKLRIRMTLVSETVSMGQTPKYNSGAIGYLDTSDMSFSIITVSRVDITYPGSVIDAVINENGYIESVNYTINMSTYAELSGMGIEGYGTLEGAQTENWKLNY